MRSTRAPGGGGAVGGRNDARSGSSRWVRWTRTTGIGGTPVVQASDVVVALDDRADDGAGDLLAAADRGLDRVRVVEGAGDDVPELDDGEPAVGRGVDDHVVEDG